MLGKLLRALALVAVWAVLFDVLSAYGLFHFFQLKGSRSPDVVYARDGRLPGVVMLRKVRAALRGAREAPARRRCRPSVTPQPLYRRDPALGYGIGPGRYELVSCPTDPENPQRYAWSLSVDPDGGRRTAYRPRQAPRRVVVLGDSWVFGWSLNDEQTMAWLLQAALEPDFVVSNLAQSGGGTTQELITMRRLADQLGPGDVVLIGYADFYPPRNVAAPSWLKDEAGFSSRYKGPQALLHPRARLVDGRVQVEMLPLDCDLLEGECGRPDPPREEMEAVTVAEYREILGLGRARKAILHVAGPDDDPVLRSLREQGATVIDARLEGGRFYTRDLVAGFDTHPGPLAHHAYFRLARAFVEGGRR